MPEPGDWRPNTRSVRAPQRVAAIKPKTPFDRVPTERRLALARKPAYATAIPSLNGVLAWPAQHISLDAALDRVQRHDGAEYIHLLAKNAHSDRPDFAAAVKLRHCRSGLLDRHFRVGPCYEMGGEDDEVTHDMRGE